MAVGGRRAGAAATAAVEPHDNSFTLMADDQLVFFSAWFCPFAQRAHIALEAKGVNYEYVECVLYEGDASTKVALPVEEKRRRNPEFVRSSPLGLVPAFHDLRRNGRVHESHVCVSYVDEAFEGPPLLPADPVERARVRAAIIYFDDKVRPHFYAILMRPDAAGRAKAAADFTAGLAGLSTRLAEGSGPFFCGSQFSSFECSVLPWLQRIFSVLAHYRGYELPTEGTDPAFDRLRAWYAACLAQPAFASTICDRERLIGNYSGYADNSATSDCAVKVRGAVGFSGTSKAAAECRGRAQRRLLVACAVIGCLAAVGATARQLRR